VVSPQWISFYHIDPETLQPVLENKMFNYMKCAYMLYGPKVKYCITYGIDTQEISIIKRKYWHNFKANLCQENFEGSKGIEFVSMNIFVVTKVDKILVYDSSTYSQIDTIPITLLKTETREPNEVIALNKDINEQFFAVISGKNLIGNAQKCNQLFVFERNKPEEEHKRDNFKFLQRVVLKDIPGFTNVCMRFYFKRGENG